MCQSPDISLVRRTVDVKYASARRAASLRWLLVNASLLAVLVYDLWVWCGAWCGALACAEALAALLLLANCAGHLARLARRPPRPLPPGAPSLGGTPPRVRSDSVVEEPGSLSPARSWRAADSPPSPPSPSHSPRGAGGGPRSPRADPDEFIADGRALAAYIRQAEARGAGAGGAGGAGGGTLVLPAPLRAHQLALLPERGGAKEPAEEEGGAEGGAGGGGRGGGGGAALWRRLHVDPERLTEYNLNLRLWLHVTVVGRVARELAAGEAAPAALHAFLAPFADRQYVADRVRELSRGGCLSAYRWDGGGRGWRAGGERPCDAELLLHLFATYMDAVAPAAGGGGAFSARHLSAAPAPAPAPRAPAPAPVLRRTARWPPHYVVLVRGETLEPGAGRNNLLHALLLLLATAARADPPALCRLHLGPAGLNMLWILGR